MSKKSHEEIAADLLIAALQSGQLKLDAPRSDARPKQLTDAYKVILAAVHQGPAELQPPKSKAK